MGFKLGLATVKDTRGLTQHMNLMSVYEGLA